MMREPSGSNSIERILYGDNAAAIGRAHSTSSSSWRTRHLNIRASYLRAALEGRAPGGLRRLLHLRGTGLVADGFTKPLYGQAFQSFVNDLGMPRRVEDLEEGVPGASRPSIAMALMTAGTMLSGVDAGEESGSEFEAVWACGAVLMCLGAIYVGQLAFASARCCLRRLCIEDRIEDEVSCWNRALVRRTASGSSDVWASGTSSFSKSLQPRSGWQQRSMWGS